MPHKPRLTPAITRNRCEYLYGQWNRGNLCYRKDIIPKIKSNLAARPDEIDDLEQSFLSYISDEHDLFVCSKCGVITDSGEYIGDSMVCYSCYDDQDNGEESYE